MTTVVNEDNPRVIPEDAPVPAAELVKVLPYGPVNGIESGFESADVIRLNEEGEVEVVEESDRGLSGEERLAEGDEDAGEE